MRAARELRRAASRRDRGEFLAEGIKLVADAVALGARPRRVFVDPDRLARSGPGRALLERLDPATVVAVSADAMQALADTRTPQGVAAVFAAELTRQATGRILLVLDGLQDPGNVGTAIRSAVASGLVETVLVRGGADPFGPKAVRAAAAALFAVRVVRPADDELPGLLRGRDVWIADAAGDRPYDAVDWRRPSALVIGSEARGASPELRALATGSVGVPLRGPVESLNAGVAASIIVFEAARQLNRTA
ncbi:MAG TPA: RNA methyltransferase [Chloroflexota bacterium]|nr:RNA methyltransferase [Chloroflexota bacterium]